MHIWLRLLTVAAVSLPAFAQPSVIELLEQKTLDRVRAVNTSVNGVLAFHAIDLTTGRGLFLNSGTVFPQASSLKIAIMIQMFRSARAGAFNLTDRLTINPQETIGGSGHLQILLRSGPVTLSVRELVSDMVGMERVNRTMEELGFHSTRLQRKMLDTASAAKDLENISTPQEMARLYTRWQIGYPAVKQLRAND